MSKMHFLFGTFVAAIAINLGSVNPASADCSWYHADVGAILEQSIALQHQMEDACIDAQRWYQFGTIEEIYNAQLDCADAFRAWVDIAHRFDNAIDPLFLCKHSEMRD